MTPLRRHGNNHLTIRSDISVPHRLVHLQGQPVLAFVHIVPVQDRAEDHAHFSKGEILSIHKMSVSLSWILKLEYE